jgi:ATP-binding cassette subfamily B protein
VLFDECTASLDAAAERAVHRAIEALAGHKTVVLITHRMGTVRTLPNIVVLAGGRVVETGTHAALLGNRGEYARLWAAYERAGDWKAAS